MHQTIPFSMKPLLLLLFITLGCDAFGQEKDEYAGFRASLEKAAQQTREHPREYPQKGYWHGWLYTDSTRRFQFSTETGDSVVNRSDGNKVNVTIFRKDVRITIMMGWYGNENLETYARKSRSSLEDNFPAGATNTHQGKLKHDKEHFTYYYTRRYTHNNRDYAMLVTFALMGSGSYDVAMTTALFYDDEQEERHEAEALKTAERISPI